MRSFDKYWYGWIQLLNLPIMGICLSLMQLSAESGGIGMGESYWQSRLLIFCYFEVLALSSQALPWGLALRGYQVPMKIKCVYVAYFSLLIPGLVCLLFLVR